MSMGHVRWVGHPTSAKRGSNGSESCLFMTNLPLRLFSVTVSGAAILVLVVTGCLRVRVAIQRKNHGKDRMSEWDRDLVIGK